MRLAWREVVRIQIVQSLEDRDVCVWRHKGMLTCVQLYQNNIYFQFKNENKIQPSYHVENWSTPQMKSSLPCDYLADSGHIFFPPETVVTDERRQYPMWVQFEKSWDTTIV